MIIFSHKMLFTVIIIIMKLLLVNVKKSIKYGSQFFVEELRCVHFFYPVKSSQIEILETQSRIKGIFL